MIVNISLVQTGQFYSAKVKVIRMPSPPSSKGAAWRLMGQSSIQFVPTYMDESGTRLISLKEWLVNDNLNWPIKLGDYSFSLVQTWCLASSRELSPSYRLNSSFCVDSMVRMIQFSSFSSFSVTVPSCQAPSTQKSTLSPTAASSETLSSESLVSKAFILSLYCSISSELSDLSMTFPRMSLIRRDSLNCSKERGSLQSEQARLCLSDSSRQGRQNVCPHSEIAGKIMIQRQMGQWNFQGPVKATNSSLPKSITFSRRCNFSREALEIFALIFSRMWWLQMVDLLAFCAAGRLFFAFCCFCGGLLGGG